MKILLVNKFHYLKGGSEKYYFDLAKLLQEKGHEVAFFSMENEKNIKTDCKEYFVKESDMNSKNIFKAFDVIYSEKNKKEMEKTLDDFKPDIVHLNNFQRQLSASIIKPIKKRHIPIVFTAHDLQAICPEGSMLDSNKNICEKCLKGKNLNCVKKKCVKDSGLKSLLGAVEGKYYRWNKIYSKKIDKIIAPSKYFKEMFIKDGIDSDRVEILHNFIDVKDYNVNIDDQGYAFYYGRLSMEKGIYNLLKAMLNIKDRKLFVAGDGPEKDNIEKFINENNMEDRVKLLGFLDSNKIKDYVRKARVVIVPSICRENCPYSVLETLAIGRPIIGSNLGGIPELVKDGEYGYIYNNIEELTEKIKKLLDDKKLAEEMGKNAKNIIKREYSSDDYYKAIMNIYNKVIGDEKNERKINK